MGRTGKNRRDWNRQPSKSSGFLGFGELAEQQEIFNPGKKNSRVFCLELRTCVAGESGGDFSFHLPAAAPRPEGVSAPFLGQMGRLGPVRT